jgi:Bacterial Ig-like domain (group 1)
VVKAVDDAGNPVAGVAVAWSAASGTGSITPATVTTGADGVAKAQATLGATGSYTFQAAVAGLVGSPVVFTSQHGPFTLSYTDPPAGTGKLRLVKNAKSTTTAVILDLVVSGSDPLVGYAAGFDLPLDDTKIALHGMNAGTALDPGSAPQAARAVLPTAGSMRGVLVVAQSHKASGTGAVADDTSLAPGTVLFSIDLDLLESAAPGVVFDGSAPGYVLPSGGLRDKAGNTVVGAADVAIGKLEVKP